MTDRTHPDSGRTTGGIVEMLQGRIAELEAQLVAEAAKTAAEKLRADQMTEQHRVQAAMHAQATERVSALEASRIAYASEFELNADGEPDVGSIHANIRALKSQLSAPRQCLHGISEPSGWRDIETAPKDSGYVLLRGRREQDVASGYWLQSAYAGNGAWIWPFVHMTPMLWAPLPPSPSSADEGGSNG
jgi:hypothetical protein